MCIYTLINLIKRFFEMLIISLYIVVFRGRQSIREVKTKHSAVGTITQKDMALTQFAFMGFAVLVNDTLGFKGDKLDGYLHFWKVVGSLLGIEDK